MVRSVFNGLCWFGLLVVLAPGSASGGWANSFVAKVEVVLEHPPDLGFTIESIAFANATGVCSSEFVDALISRFIDNGVEVVERERLEDLLESIDLSASGYVRNEDVVALSEILGPSALVFLDVQRCTDVQDRSVKSRETKKGTRRTYTASTTSYFKSSLRIVDVASGRIHSSKVVEETRQEKSTSSDGYPDYPSKFELHDAAIAGAVEQVHRMFFPWSEAMELRFFKDEKCGLKEAYRLVQVGDLEGAVARSTANVEQCKTQSKIKPRLQARAYYNLGLSQFLRGAHGTALGFFERAYRIKPGERMREAVNTCKRAIQLDAEMRAYESRLADRREGGGRLLGDSQGVAESRTIRERLRELEDLYRDGLLTEEQYNDKRAEILAEL